MATVIYPTARKKSNESIKPINGEKFTLEELQKLVGGYIAPIHLPNGDQFIVNEDGLNLGLEENLEATLICLKWGVHLEFPIVGTVVYCKLGEFE